MRTQEESQGTTYHFTGEQTQPTSLFKMGAKQMHQTIDSKGEEKIAAEFRNIRSTLFQRANQS